MPYSVKTKQAAEAEAYLFSDSVKTKQAAEAEAFFISDSVAAELFLISENCGKLHAACVKYIRYF